METCTSIETRNTFTLHGSHYKSSATAIKPPCEAVLDSAEAFNRQNGHENAGFLSRVSGFMPLNQPLTQLPAAYRVWDDLANSLPSLLNRSSLSATISAMPTLSAKEEHLPARYLRRASMILSLVSHALINIEKDKGPLPECLEKPWSEVANRLGYDKPFLSYIDLIVYNWRGLTGEVATKDLRVKDIELLVPTVGNREESIFYLAQTEIVAQTTPLIHHVIAAQQAALAGDNVELTAIICKMTNDIHKLARLSLNSISPRATNSRRVDPVVWAKTVAPLAAPIRPDVLGPGGIASPVFHMMDAFIGRQNYSSFLGREMQKIQQTYPPHWRAFLKAVRDVPISVYINRSNDTALGAAWDVLQESYYGREGLLGLHRRKVYAYLVVSFKAGRKATTADVKGEKGEDGWMKVSRELEQSRQERHRRSGEISTANAIDDHVSCVKSSDRKPQFSISKLARHCNPTEGFWFAANGQVYDVTSYMRFHPGGDKILINSAGRDVTADLHAVSHFTIPTIRSKLDKFIIGQLDIQSFSDRRLQSAYDYTVALVYKAVDSQTTYQNDVTFLDERLTSADQGPEELTPQKLRWFAASQDQVCVHHVPTLVGHVLAVAQELLHDQPSLDLLLDSATRIEQIGSNNPIHHSGMGRNDVRLVVKNTDKAFDAVRLQGISLLESFEELNESSEQAKEGMTTKSEQILMAMMDILMQTIMDQRDIM